MRHAILEHGAISADMTLAEAMKNVESRQCLVVEFPDDAIKDFPKNSKEEFEPGRSMESEAFSLSAYDLFPEAKLIWFFDKHLTGNKYVYMIFVMVDSLDAVNAVANHYGWPVTRYDVIADNG